MYTSVLATVAAGVLVAAYPDGVCAGALVLHNLLWLH
jgi:hypothetical protein